MWFYVFVLIFVLFWTTNKLNFSVLRPVDSRNEQKENQLLFFFIHNNNVDSRKFIVFLDISEIDKIGLFRAQIYCESKQSLHSAKEQKDILTLTFLYPNWFVVVVLWYVWCWNMRKNEMAFKWKTYQIRKQHCLMWMANVCDVGFDWILFEFVQRRVLFGIICKFCFQFVPKTKDKCTLPE